METVVETKKCPFCSEMFNTTHKKAILKRERNWLVTESMTPDPNSRYHFIIISPQWHRESPIELGIADIGDVLVLVQWVIRNYHLEGGEIRMSFGPSTITGDTIHHLHACLIVPKEKS